MSAHPPDPANPLDDETVERLLAGRLAPEATPSAYGEVARLLQAAAGPSQPHELAGQATAMAAFRAHRRPPRRGRLRVRVVAVTVAGALLAGGAAAAATGGRPVPVERVVRTARGATAPARGQPMPPRLVPATSTPATGTPTGPAPPAGAKAAAHSAKPGKPKQQNPSHAESARPKKPKANKPKQAAVPTRR